jgi:hypothetical protein
VVRRNEVSYKKRCCIAFSIFLLKGGAILMNTPYVQDNGLHSRVPETGIRMTTFVEAYHRLNGDLAQLQTGFHIEPWQLHAAMTFYCANKQAFDAEYERILEQRQRNLREMTPVNPEVVASWFASLPLPEREEASDEEMDALMEEMS